MKPIKKILVPTDFSEISRVGLRFAFSLAAENEADLLVVHVGSEFQVWQVFDEGTFFNDRVYKWEVDKVIKEGHLDLNRFLEKHTEELRRVPTVRKKVVLGDVVNRIVDVAREEEVDLIVMSPRPHGTLKRFFLGSVTDRVTRKAPCPVVSLCLEKLARPLRGKLIPAMPAPLRNA
jgi:universal stress protein A